MNGSYILEVRDLKKYFGLNRGLPAVCGQRETNVVKAVDGVSFGVKEGEIFALVGRSGCGKTTLAKTMVGLYEPTGGEVLYRGCIVSGTKSGVRSLRREVQMIFQDSGTALNPRLSIYQSLEEPLLLRGVKDKKEREKKIRQILERVNLPAHLGSRRPHELSGGQRQRVCLARALLLDPHVLIADEPMSGLDLSVKAQVWNLLLDLQEEMNLTYVLISHDLSTIAHLADRVALMQAGKIVKIIDAQALLGQRTTSHLEV